MWGQLPEERQHHQRGGLVQLHGRCAPRGRRWGRGLTGGAPWAGVLGPGSSSQWLLQGFLELLELLGLVEGGRAAEAAWGELPPRVGDFGSGPPSVLVAA